MDERDEIRTVFNRPLFSGEPIPEQDLVSAQGIAGPQGLDAIAAIEWTDEDEAFLVALCGD